MAKKLNKNLVLGLAVLGFTITTAAGVLMVKMLQQTDPTEFASRAEQYAKNEDWSHAFQYYNRAYRTSQETKYLVLGADMLRKLGKEIEALKLLQTAVVMAPDMLEAQEKILDLQLEISDMSPFSTESWLNVRTTCEAILELDGQEEHPRALYGLGAALLGLKEQSPENESRGVEYLQKALAVKPGAIEPIRRMVEYDYSLDREDDADALLEEAVQRNMTPGKDAADARCMLAAHQTRSGNFDRAAELYDEAQKFAGDDPEVQAEVQAQAGYFWLRRWTNLKAEKGEDAPEQAKVDDALANAISAAEMAIEAEPDGFSGYFLRADIYRQQGDLPKAIEVLEKRRDLPFQREGFKYALTRYYRYSLLITLADLHTALASDELAGSEQRNRLAGQARMYIEDARGEFHTRPEASHSEGKLAFVLGEYSEAVKAFERSEDESVRINPVNLHYLALARMQLGQTGGALEAVQRAVSVPGADSGTWTTYSRVLQALGRSREALEAANRALEINPDNDQARFARAAALEGLQSYTELEQEIVKIGDDRPEIVAAKARYMATRDQVDVALSMLDKGLENMPGNVPLITTKAAVLNDAGRRSDAQAVIEKALTAKPDDFDLRLAKLQYSDLSTDERRSEYTKLVMTIPDEFDRARRLAGIYAGENDEAGQREQLTIAKDLIIKGATPLARKAGESALRTIVDRLMELHARNQDFVAIDALVQEASDWNDGAGLDGAEGLSYRGRRMLIEAFQITRKAREASKDGDDIAAERDQKLAHDKYQEAIDTLQRALDKFPSSAETFAQLGEAYLQTDRFAEARAALEKSNDLLPRNLPVVKRLASVCRRLGDDSAYKNWLTVAKTVAPNDPWVVDQMLVEEEQNDPRAGIARREELRQANPDDILNLAALARLYNRVGDSAKADETVTAILGLEDAPKYLTQIAGLLREIGKPDRARDLLDQHLRDAPADEKAEAQIMLAEHYAAVGDPQADAAFLAAADLDANESVCLAIGQHLFRTSRYRAADEWFTKAFEKAKAARSVRMPAIYQVRIDTLIRLDRLDEAQALCDEYKEAYPEDPTASFLEAEIFNAHGESEKAIATLSRYLEATKRGANSLSDYRRKIALFRRAQFYQNRGRVQDAIDDLVSLVSADPTALNFAPRILLSRAYDTVKQPERAVKELENVYREHPEATDVIKELVDRYLRDDRLNDADRVLAAMLSREPENVEWLLRSGDVAVAQGDHTKALANYKLAAKVSGYSPSVTNKLFDACAKFKQPAEGIQFFENAIPPSQRQPEVILGYAKLLAARGDADDAVNMCRLALHRRGYASFDFLLNLGKTIYQMFGTGARERFEKTPAEDIFERDNQHILGMLCQFGGELDRADEIHRKLLEDSTDDAEQAQLWFRIGLSHSERKEPAEARKAYENALEKDENHMAALNNLAYLLSSEPGETKQAIAYAKRAVSAASKDTIIEALDTLGYAYLADGNFLAAIAKLSQAHENDPDYAPATFHLGEAYRRRGDFDSAEKLFEQVVQMPQGTEYEEFRQQARDGLNKAKSRQSD